MPKRIQMSRQHPWRADNPDAVIVARPSKWGNPYRITTQARYRHVVRGPGAFSAHDHAIEARRMAVSLFELGVAPFGSIEYDGEMLAQLRAELAGRDLACWCPLDQPCHADVLLELANPVHLCPECEQGKCRNCVEQTLNDADEWVPCGCPEHEGTT